MLYLNFEGTWRLRNGETRTVHKNTQVGLPWYSGELSFDENGYSADRNPEFDLMERLSDRAGKMK